jgi:hypothetical protein
MQRASLWDGTKALLKLVEELADEAGGNKAGTTDG